MMMMMMMMMMVMMMMMMMNDDDDNDDDISPLRLFRFDIVLPFEVRHIWAGLRQISEVLFFATYSVKCATNIVSQFATYMVDCDIYRQRWDIYG